MAVHYKTLGFVLRKEDRQEADRVFSIFTQDFGKIEIFAKAIRKIESKLRGGIEIFSLSQIEFIQGKNKKTLTDALLLDRRNSIAKNPEKFEIAARISTIIEQFIRGQETDQNIMDFIVSIFEKLDAGATNSKFLYYYFFWNFVALLGYGPELSKCVICGQSLQPNHLYFSYKEGGVLCFGCSVSHSDAKKINSDTVKILRLVVSMPSKTPANQKSDWETLSKLKVALASKKLLKEISDTYYDYLSGTISRPAYHENQYKKDI